MVVTFRLQKQNKTDGEFGKNTKLIVSQIVSGELLCLICISQQLNNFNIVAFNEFFNNENDQNNYTKAISHFACFLLYDLIISLCVPSA